MKAGKVLMFLTVVILLMGLVLGTSCGGQGPTGVGIQSVVNNGNGTFTLKMTDGSSFTTDNLTGSQGGQGATGVGIQSIVDNGNGTFTITLTNGSTFTTDNLTGPTMPVIQSLSVSDLPAKPGTTVTASVVAQSAAALVLTYNWTATSGWTIASGGNSSAASITAPATYAASGSATVTVTDSENRTATGTISLSTERNLAPIINSIWTSGNPVRKGGIIDFFTSSADPNGDTITYQWSVPSGWTIQSGVGTNHITVQAPDQLLASGYTSLTVNDGNGSSATAYVYIAVQDGAWATAELIETDNSGDADYPQVAVDSSGDAIAVWSQSDGIRYNIWANRFVPGIGWGTAVLIETDNSGSAYGPQVAVDSSGNAMAVWYQDNGAGYRTWANRFVPGIGWGTAVLIQTDNTWDAVFPQVAVDYGGNSGDFTAVWQQYDGTRYNIWANHFVPGTGWGTAVLIETDNSGDALYPQVAVDSSGNAMAVWYQYDSTRYNIWANRFVPGIGWGTAVLIETDNSGSASYPQVAVDSRGNATAVWYQNDGTRFNIWANRFVPGTGWGTAVLIETDNSGDAYSPQVAVDASGNAMAVWCQWDGTRMNTWANRFVPGTGWGTAVLIETDNSGDAASAQVAVDANGNAMAVWYQDNGAGYRTWANRFVPGIGWGTAVLIQTDNSGSAYHPQVAVDASGNAMAVWYQWDGTRYSILNNRFQ